MGWVHIANIKGADGAPGTPGGSQYVHDQTSAASVWNVNHNLGYFPHISIIMDDGTIVVADIDHLSATLANITFPSPYTGKAVCS
jgi:hypothetical protein